jgi:hypothetical protein
MHVPTSSFAPSPEAYSPPASSGLIPILTAMISQCEMSASPWVQSTDSTLAFCIVEFGAPKQWGVSAEYRL